MKVDAFLYITDVACPITLVKTKVALEDLDDEQILELRLNDGEPVQNVPRSLKDVGHKILKLEDNVDVTFTLWIEKAGLLLLLPQNFYTTKRSKQRRSKFIR